MCETTQDGADVYVAYWPRSVRHLHRPQDLAGFEDSELVRNSETPFTWKAPRGQFQPALMRRTLQTLRSPLLRH